MLQHIQASAETSIEVKIILEELKALLAPYFESARELRDLKLKLCWDAKQASQATRNAMRPHFVSMQRHLEMSRREVRSLEKSAQLDRSIMQEHLTAIVNTQLQSVGANLTLTASVDKIREELSNLLLDEGRQTRRRLREQEEQLRLMRQSFEEARIILLQSAHSQEEKSTMPHDVSRRVARPWLQYLDVKLDALFDWSVITDFIFHSLLILLSFTRLMAVLKYYLMRLLSALFSKQSIKTEIDRLQQYLPSTFLVP